MDRFRVARFECEGDVREVFVGAEGDGVVICEELSGPSAQIAFGEEGHVRAVRLTPRAVSEVMAEIGFAGSQGALWDYLADERRDLTDLVDLCRERGIPCEVMSGGGSASGDGEAFDAGAARGEKPRREASWRPAYEAVA